MRLRTVPGTALRVSELGFALGAASTRLAPAASHVALVRRAVALGVSLFDVSEAPNPLAFGSIVDREVAAAGQRATLLLPAPSDARPGREPLDERIGARPAWHGGLTVVDQARPAPPGRTNRGPDAGPTASFVRPDSPPPQWDQWETAEASAAALVDERRPPTLWKVRGNLLNAVGLRLAAASAATQAGGLVVSDPFAGGRLLGGSPEALVPRGPAAGPPLALNTLVQGWAPVLRLGFLTDKRRRTLPQAALQYPLTFPGVVSVLVPFRSIVELEWVGQLEETPPLTDEELARVDDSAALGNSSVP